ncbi:ribonuclease P protein component [Candidatus Saccharibacteria bacterium]|jgi:ribonuclease P protein component|nr:ribonuclease P protein component [Candidatus Saccharibacteria bacterium]
MLSQAYRFHGHGSLRYVYKNGKTVRCRLFTLRYIDNPRRKLSRFSVVISKKVSKSAVVRNRIRRRIYEIVRTHLPEIKGTYDVVFIVSLSEIADMPYSELFTLIGDQLLAADILPSPD